MIHFLFNCYLSGFWFTLGLMVMGLLSLENGTKRGDWPALLLWSLGSWATVLLLIIIRME